MFVVFGTVRIPHTFLIENDSLNHRRGKVARSYRYLARTDRIGTRFSRDRRLDSDLKQCC